MKLKIKKLREDAVFPKYANPGDSGFDLSILEDVSLMPGITYLAKTGLSVEVPEGFELQIRPRSGLSLKSDMVIKNSPGTIDAGYRGEIGIIIKNGGQTVLRLKRGDRIAQGVVCPVIRAELIETTDLTETERGDGGFGSSGV